MKKAVFWAPYTDPAGTRNTIKFLTLPELGTKTEMLYTFYDYSLTCSQVYTPELLYTFKHRNTAILFDWGVKTLQYYEFTCHFLKTKISPTTFKFISWYLMQSY